MTVLFDHIAIGVPRIDDTTEFLVGRLGGVATFGAPSGEFRFWQWRFANGGVIEILEPFGDPGGFMHRFLENPGPGVHHVTFKVPELEETCRRAESLGYTVVGKNVSDPGWKEAFLHPRQAQGIVIQFVESDPGADEERDRPDSPEWRQPAEPEPAGSTVDLIGLRLSATGRREATRQWSEFLQADSVVDAGDDELVFSWQGSPMSIRVVIDPERRPGPLCIELSSASHLDLPATPIEPFGTRFVPVDPLGSPVPG